MKPSTFSTVKFPALVILLSCAANVFAATKPNILVIMADDVGWASLGSYHQGIKTIGNQLA